jgi:flagellar biosynthesis/type III secretory pathway chaperone
MRAEEMSPDLRLHLVEALELLSQVLDEETDKVARSETEGLDLYLTAKRQLFERLGVLLRQAHRPGTSRPVEIPATLADSAEDGVEDPAPPARLREAADRVRASIAANLRTLTAAQEAVTAVTRHMARIAARQQADGVYGRRGSAPQRSVPGYGRVEHQL